MKLLFSLITTSISFIQVSGQTTPSNKAIPDSNKKIQIVEVACGQCKLGLPGTTCDLAVRINGKAYFVDGTNIDEHGDAHAKDGFCNAISKAKVQGEIVDNRFKATYFELVKPKKTKAAKSNIE